MIFLIMVSNFLKECLKNKRDNKNFLIRRVKTENTRDNLRRIQFDDECKKLKINPKKLFLLIIINVMPGQLLAVHLLKKV